MGRAGRVMRIGAAGALLVAARGCGGRPPASASKETAAVKGTVTIHGKSASGGTVTFDPSNVNRPDAPSQSATIGADGSYSLTALVGENSVTTQGPEVAKDPGLATNRVLVVVKPGENVIPITLPEGNP